MDKILQKSSEKKNEILESQRKVGEILYYLEISERYREDEQYKKFSFDKFLQHEFGFSYNQYKKILKANERNEIYWY